MINCNIYQLFTTHHLPIGRMISFDKRAPVGCTCVWNANGIIKSKGKVWYGDINITRDGDKLKKIASELGETIYILKESDCRFDTENDDINMLINKAVWSTEKELI